MTDIASLAQREGFQTVHADALDHMHVAAKGVVERMVNNASKVAALVKVKKIKMEHLHLVENIQTGGRVVLPAAYFEGTETEGYLPKEAVAPFETTASFVDVTAQTRPEHAIKVLGGAPRALKLDAAFVADTVKSMKTGFSVDKAAQAHIADKAQHFSTLLVKAVRKQYPKQKTLKASMVKKVLEKSMLA